MAWTVPITAVANDVWTVDQYNIHVRDNLLETAPAVVSAAGQYVVADGANSLTTRVPDSDHIMTGTGFADTAQTTSSLTYTNLATVGPTVTVTTGTTALVHIAAYMSNSAVNVAPVMSVEVSGASTIAAADDWAVFIDGRNFGQGPRQGAWTLFTTLTPGSNTFTCKYRVNDVSTGSFNDRHLIVVPF